MGVKHLMVSESKSRCGRTVVQGDGADCKNCARVKWVPTGQTYADIRAERIIQRETARAEAVEASIPVEGDYVYRESDGSQGMVDDKTRHGRLVVVFVDGTERSVFWDVLVGEGFERITAAEYAEGVKAAEARPVMDDFAMLDDSIAETVARLHYFSRVLIKDAHLMLDVSADQVDAARKAGLIVSRGEWLSVTSAAVGLLTGADKVDAHLHFNPRPAVESGSTIVQPDEIRKPIRTCLAKRKRKATRRARSRVGGGW